MGAIEVILFSNDLTFTPNRTVSATGSRTGGRFELDTLRLPSAGGYEHVELTPSIAGGIEKLSKIGPDRYCLNHQDGGWESANAKFRLQPGQVIFGEAVAAEMDGKISILQEEGARGTVLLEFATDMGSQTRPPLQFSVAMPIPAIVGEKPEFPAPHLGLAAPRFAGLLPSLDVDWAAPLELPHLDRWRLPGSTVDMSPLPMRLRYLAAEFHFNKRDDLVLEMRGVSIFAQDSFLIDKLEIKARKTPAGVLVSAQIFFDGIGHHVQWECTHGEGGGCLLVSGSGSQLGRLFDCFVPELNEFSPRTTHWKARALWDDAGATELRIDLRVDPRSEVTAGLPGFKVNIEPNPNTSLHLVFFRRNDSFDFWLGVNNWRLKAESHFTWDRSSSRELLKDPAWKNDPLITVDVKPSSDTYTLLLMRVAGTRVEFFEKTAVPIRLIDWTSTDSRCKPTINESLPLTSDDVNLAPTLSADLGRPFGFPFLRGPSQVLEVTAGTLAQVPDENGFLGCKLNVRLAIGEGSSFNLNGTFDLRFDWRKLAFQIDGEDGGSLRFKLEEGERHEAELFGFRWVISELPGANGFFELEGISNSNYRLKQLPNTIVSLQFNKATAGDSAIEFSVENLVVSAAGVSLDAKVKDTPAKLRALNTEFRFSEGLVQVRENRIDGFGLKGTGALPPALVGESRADIELQFSQDEKGAIGLVSASARLHGELLKCENTRFRFKISALGLEFIDDGEYHFYFTLTGTASFVLADGDSADGPLAWLPGLSLDLVECPLTGDTTVLGDHVRFLIELPKKRTFPFLGCFDMELRAIEFVSHDPVFPDNRPAMRLTGQVKFAEGGGDAVSAKVDFHDLHIGKPDPGSLVPRLHLKGLAVKIASGSAFELMGSVDFLDEGTDLGGGVTGEGFRGGGELVIQGLPKFTVSFAFLRVKHSSSSSPVRAWFIYVKASRMSLEIPVVHVFLREVGLGFGYRYTLAMIKTSDKIVDDPRKLLRVLKDQARSQGELDRFDQWRPDLEEPSGGPRWTVALRALFAQHSPAAGPFDWNNDAEDKAPCMFVVDALAALRSDLTFLMVGRAWLWANYFDYENDRSDDGRGFRTRPMFAGFMLLSPRNKRLLANFSSQKDPAFGEQGKAFSWLRDVAKNSNYTATLLVEPGLVHYELGWPNQLQWEADFGGLLKLAFRGGMIIRASKSEFVIGQSFLAQGSLRLDADVNFGFVGARIWASADISLGARYIGVISFNRASDSAFYGAAGVGVRAEFGVSFWIHIDVIFGKIELDFSFSVGINFTALVEIGIPLTRLPGFRGAATLGLSFMGHNLQFDVDVGVNRDSVTLAKDLTAPFLQIGLEAADVEPVLGNIGALREASQPDGEFGARHFLDRRVPPHMDPEPGEFAVPDYSTLVLPPKGSDEWFYFLLLPAGEDVLTGRRERGFLPVPHFGDPKAEYFDFCVTMSENPSGAGVTLQRLQTDGRFSDVELIDREDDQDNEDGDSACWKVRWNEMVGSFVPDETGVAGSADGNGQQQALELGHLVSLAFIPWGKEKGDKFEEMIEPQRDPVPLPDDEAIVEDQRVRDPADDAFEAAVRGAAEQFEAAPYFRNSGTEYDVALTEAFDPGTSIYASTSNNPDGQFRSEGTLEDDAKKSKQALQMRSTLIRELTSQFQSIVEGARHNENRQSTTVLAHELGLVFRCKGSGVRRWLGLDHTDVAHSFATIRQRIDPQSTDLSESTGAVRLFNRDQFAFDTNPPRFREVRTFAHSTSIAISWDLSWDKPRKDRQVTRAGMLGRCPNRCEDPEHHLDHYVVTRRCLDGSEPDPSPFKVRTPDVLHRKKDAADEQADVLMRCRSRFQFVDSFPKEDLASLPKDGRKYLYTVTPIDLAGRPGRSMTAVALRRPDAPPMPIPNGELVVTYDIGVSDFPRNRPLGSLPKTMRPASVSFSWEAPPPASTESAGAINACRLVFRRDEVFPAGSYGVDTDIAGSRARGLPTSNARLLGTDSIYEFDLDNRVERAPKGEDSDRLVRHIDLACLQSIGLLPPFTTGDGNCDGKRVINPPEPTDNPDWRPEAWRVFVQTKSESGVYSALTPVQVALRFRRKVTIEGPPQPNEEEGKAEEERRFGSLEWMPLPYALPVLPPEDVGGRAGHVSVPMPPSQRGSGNSLSRAEFRRHLSRRRAIQIVWNARPSGSLSSVNMGAETTDVDHYPDKLVAGFELYEFDADSHTSTGLDIEAKSDESEGRVGEKGIDFEEWVDEHSLQKIQEVEIADSQLALITPSDTSDPQMWEAWYPSTTRRMEVAEETSNASPVEPSHNGAALSPWFSWRESYLVWPNPEWTDPRGKTQSLLDGNRRTGRVHPLLAWIASAAAEAAGEDCEVQWGAQATASATDLAGLMRATVAQVDPYGWGILQRIGLAGSFSLRRKGTGDPVPPEVLERALDVALEDLPVDEQVQKHLFVESLYQQGRSNRLHKPGSSIDSRTRSSDLSAIVQISLRPSFDCHSTYYAAESIVIDSQVIADSQVVSLKLRKHERQETPFHATVVVEAGGDRHEFAAVLDTDGTIFSRRVPASAPVRVLIKASAQNTAGCPFILEVKTKDTYKVQETKEFAPTDSRALYFFVNASASANWPQRTAHEAWQRLDEYLQATGEGVRLPVPGGVWPNAPEAKAQYDTEKDRTTLEGVVGASPDWVGGTFILETSEGVLRSDILKPDGEASAEQLLVRGLVLPEAGMYYKVVRQTEVEGPSVSDVLLWLARYFEHGPAGPPADVASSVANAWWSAAAYPRTTTPTNVVPDPASGQLTYTHHIEDQFAHSYRYYVRPVGRYDRIWRSVASSSSIFDRNGEAGLRSLDGKENHDPVAQNLETLRTISRPKPGGFDEVLDRVRPVSKPTILYSGRPDAADRPLALEDARAKWTVVIAKHPEQTLIERNRTLARQLAFRQIAFSLFRRFRDTVEQGSLASWSGSYQTRAYETNESFLPPGVTTLTVEVTSAGHERENVPETKTETFDLDLQHNNLEAARDLVNATSGLREMVEASVEKWEDEAKDAKAHQALFVTPKAGEIRTVRFYCVRAPGSSVTEELLVNPRLEYLVTLPRSRNGAVELPQPTDAAPTASRLDRLADRFGSGAQVVEWESLPYYYDHVLMAVAQASDVVSPATSIVQRDFEYESPTANGKLALPPARPSRGLLTVRICLAEYWCCLTENGRKRWRVENEPADSANLLERVPASLPDPAVVYQLLLMSPGQVEQLLAEFRFRPQSYGRYQCRSYRARVGGRDLEVEVQRLGSEETTGRFWLDATIASRSERPDSQFQIPVTSTHDLRSVDNVPGFTTAPPTASVLVALKPLDEQQIGRIFDVLTSEKFDKWFRAAAREFCDELRRSEATSGVRVHVPLGLEQLSELHADHDGVSFEGRTLVWRGPLSDEVRRLIRGMMEVSPFPDTLDALANADDSQFDGQVFRVRIVDTGWAERPRLAELKDLRDLVAILNGSVVFEGSLSDTRHAAFRECCMGQEANLQAADHLRRRHLETVLGGGTVALRCYRGTADLSELFELPTH